MEQRCNRINLEKDLKTIINSEIEKRDILSIKIKNTSCGHGKSDENTTESLELINDGFIYHNYYNHYGYKVVKTNEYFISSFEMRKFFKYVMEYIKIDEWKDEYYSGKRLGHSWKCEVVFSNGCNKIIQGNIVLPYRGEEFVSGVLSLTNYIDDPWIFLGIKQNI